MNKPIKTIISIAVSGLMFHQASFAGGFSLYTEGSAAEVGNFAAGAAAEGADASIGYYNPAGLVLIRKQQAVFSGVGVFPSTKITGTSTYAMTYSGVVLPSYIQNFSGLSGGKNAVVPALHYAKPLGERATFGLSITSPFGLATDWGNGSPVRYEATLTDLKTINVSPELGGLLTDNLSIGAGLDLQAAQVKFNRVLGLPPLLNFIKQSPTAYDSLSYNKGHSFGVGFHAGVLGMFNNKHTRLGINYQSEIEHEFNGYSLLTGRLADTPQLTNPNASYKSDSLYSNSISLPDMTTFSIYQDINPRLALLASAIYTGWSSFDAIKLYNVAAVSSDLANHALVNSTAEQNYKDVWRFAVGANYRFTDTFMLRLGAGYDETPTVDARRDVRLPDANRVALAIGGHYQFNPSLGFDLGYTYLFAKKDPLINRTDPIGTTSSYNVNATANVHAQLFGLQAVWTIDKDTTK